jgi:hypothetical protein
VPSSGCSTSRMLSPARLPRQSPPQSPPTSRSAPLSPQMTSPHHHPRRLGSSLLPGPRRIPSPRRPHRQSNMLAPSHLPASQLPKSFSAQSRQRSSSSSTKAIVCSTLVQLAPASPFSFAKSYAPLGRNTSRTPTLSRSQRPPALLHATLAASPFTALPALA